MFLCNLAFCMHAITLNLPFIDNMPLIREKHLPNPVFHYVLVRLIFLFNPDGISITFSSHLINFSTARFYDLEVGQLHVVWNC